MPVSWAIIPPHSFRATGITNYLENGETLEVAQRIAGHADSRTTKLLRPTRAEGFARRYGADSVLTLFQDAASNPIGAAPAGENFHITPKCQKKTLCLHLPLSDSGSPPCIASFAD